MPVNHRLLLPVLMLGLHVSALDAVAQTGADLVQKQCVACHSIKSSELTEQDRIQQKGPALDYAGIKYRQDWLQEWLQNPERIRPGGMIAANHTIVTDEGDVIDEESLSNHVSLSAAEATSIAEYLMTLTAKSELVTPGEYKPKKVSQRMAAMNFSKFKGCSSCHQDDEGIGGVSGPELYTSYNRLNPDFMVSFIRNPLAWEDVSPMPHVGLKDKEIYKLVHYLKLLSGEE